MTAAVSPNLVGLLFVGEADESHVNLGAAGGALATYVRNGATLAGSARAAGQAFTLVTNDAARIEAVLEAENLSGAVALREHAFTLDVPRGISFRSAHFKLELLRLFGEGAFGSHPALVDLDAVLLRPVALPDAEQFWSYDISAQMWGEAPNARAVASLESLAGQPIAHPRWYGGEFLAGPAARFAELWFEIEALWPRYLDLQGELYHSGDEMLLSAALNRLAQRDWSIGDAGAARLVSRWWSRRTLNPMPALADALEAALVHLPADKHWLAQQAGRCFDGAQFAAALRRHAAARLPAERAKSLAERLLGRPPQNIPHLA